jgi:hypothetical protein
VESVDIKKPMPTLPTGSAVEGKKVSRKKDWVSLYERKWSNSRECRANDEAVHASDDWEVLRSITSLDLVLVGPSSEGASASFDAVHQIRCGKPGIPIIAAVRCGPSS